MRKRRDNWLPAQDAVLLVHWPKGTAMAEIGRLVSDAGPWHSPDAINRQVKRLKLRRPPGFLARHVRSLTNRAIESFAPPETECTTEIRDGVTVIVCPPAYAYGAYRADQIWSGWVYGSRWNRKGAA